MKQQTAVEWLVDELKQYIQVDWPVNKTIRRKIEQAKQMHKEQILNARLDGFKISGEGLKKSPIAQETLSVENITRYISTND